MSPDDKEDDDLDTKTTFADMNVEGFGWYDPTLKKGETEQKVKRKVSRKEYHRIVKGAFSAMFPAIFIFFASIAVVGILLYLWLK